MSTTQKKIAVVTGGTAGLGLVIAEKFTEAGFFTIVIGRDETRLRDIKDRMGEMGDVIAFDLANLAGIPGLIAGIRDRYGRIDVLVNNAGVNMKKNFLEVTDEDFQNVLTINVNAVFALSREVVKVMDVQGAGSIIHVSSMAALYGIPKVIAYTASKSAIEGMTRAMAVELSPRGIRVNVVAPGFIETDMSARAFNEDEERKQKVLSRTPIGHLGKPGDVADAVLFLAGDSARYITGTSIRVDGGNAIGF